MTRRPECFEFAMDFIGEPDATALRKYVEELERAAGVQTGPIVVVEVKNDILGDSMFWRGPPERIDEIHNIPARETAKQVVKDGKARTNGMWCVRMEQP